MRERASNLTIMASLAPPRTATEQRLVERLEQYARFAVHLQEEHAHTVSIKDAQIALLREEMARSDDELQQARRAAQSMWSSRRVLVDEIQSLRARLREMIAVGRIQQTDSSPAERALLRSQQQLAAADTPPLMPDLSGGGGGDSNNITASPMPSSRQEMPTPPPGSGRLAHTAPTQVIQGAKAMMKWMHTSGVVPKPRPFEPDAPPSPLSPPSKYTSPRRAPASAAATGRSPSLSTHMDALLESELALTEARLRRRASGATPP